ncbi:MAG TPA: CHASE domain-containing protein [Roseovarius sp.]
MSKTVEFLLQNLAFALFVAVFGVLSLGLASPSGIATPVWMAAGIAAFAFWRCGLPVLPGALVGMYAVFVSSSWARTGADGDVLQQMSMAIAPALIATIHPLVTVRLLKMVSGNSETISRKSKSVMAGLAATIPAAVLFAGFSVIIVHLGSAERALGNWLLLSAGNLFGVLIFFPGCLLLGRAHSQVGSGKIASYSSYALMLTILLISMAGTSFAWKSIHDSIQRYHQSRFDALTLESRDALKFRISSYEQALLGANGLLIASSKVKRREWKEYVEASRIRERFSGINGIGYIVNVADEDKEAFIAAARQDGMPDFADKPEGVHPANYIIFYIEPVGINLSAVGLNIAFEENRRRAAQSSMATGRSTLTKRILLVQDAEKTPGFLLLLPHYKLGAPLDTVAQRRAATLGWVYAPFIAKNFLHDLTSSQGETINLRIYDGVTTNPEDLIFDSGGRHSYQTTAFPHFTSSAQVQVMEQPWTLVWESTAKFNDGSINKAALMVALGGATLTGFLALIFVMIIRRNAQVRAEVDRKTKKIAQAKGRLQAVLDTVVDGIVSICESACEVDPLGWVMSE